MSEVKPDEVHVTVVEVYRRPNGTTNKVTIAHHTPCRGVDCKCDPIVVSDLITPREPA